MVDLVTLLETHWFGKPEELDDFGIEPAPPLAQHQHQRRRGSASSLAEAAEAANDGGVRERLQNGAGSASPEQGPPHLMRKSGNRAVQQQQQNGRAQEEEEEDGVLGTWAGRQRVLLSDNERQQQPRYSQQQHPAAVQEEEEREESPAAVVLRPWGAGLGPTAVIEQAEASRARAANGGEPARAQQAAQPGADSLDQEMNAAWRWRFTRKWHAEQMKQFEGPAAAGGPGEEGDDEEEWSAALRMLGAVDGGINMQIGRTLSLHNSSSAMESSMEQSLTLMSPGLSQCMLLDGSIKESPLREEASDATSALMSVARKALHLQRQQQEIERRVSERWEAAAGGSQGGPAAAQWVAQHLPAVQIDSWSAFPFVLVRLSEPQRSQRQKLLVRGRNGSTEHQAFAAAEQEAAKAAITHRLPGPRVELVAAGRMEWVAAAPAGGQGQQRRTLRVRATRLLPPAAKDSRLHSMGGASAVVADVARASFPAGDFDIVAVDPATDRREVRVGAPLRLTAPPGITSALT